MMYVSAMFPGWGRRYGIKGGYPPSSAPHSKLDLKKMDIVFWRSVAVLVAVHTYREEIKKKNVIKKKLETAKKWGT